MSAPAAVYRPRNPQDSDYYRCVEDYFETFIQIYDKHFSRQYGFWRPYVEQVIYRYLDCGNLHNGFARVKCKDCGHEYLLAFSCKRRHFCPSCHQKRVVEFGEWLCMDVLKKIPHRHFVFSIPKILRRYFLYDRKLLADLSRCAWESLKVFLQDGVPEDDPIPGAIIAMQTFGDFLGFNPNTHILVTDGFFYGDGGMFRVAPPLELKKLEAIFRHKVFRMLLDKGKITQELIAMLSSWRHSGFNVFCGNRISPDDDTAMENLARYIILNATFQTRPNKDGADPPLSRDRLNDIYKKAANDPDHLVVYSEEQNVSTDLIGMDAAIVIEGQFNHTRTAFIDVDLSHVPDLPEAFLKTLSQSILRIPVVHAKIFGWYDNEYDSYTNRLGDLTTYIHQSLFR